MSKTFSVILPLKNICDPYKNSEAINSVSIEVKQCVNAIDMHGNDLFRTCTAVIPSVANILKQIYLSNNLFTEFESKLFQNKEVYFSYFIRHHIENTVKYIHHHGFMNEWKSKMENEAYERNLEKRVALLSERNLIDSRSETKLSEKMLDELRWFGFQGVILHVAYKIKDTQPDIFAYLLNVFICFS